MLGNGEAHRFLQSRGKAYSETKGTILRVATHSSSQSNPLRAMGRFAEGWPGMLRVNCSIKEVAIGAIVKVALAPMLLPVPRVGQLCGFSTVWRLTPTRNLRLTTRPDHFYNFLRLDRNHTILSGGSLGSWVEEKRS